MRKLNVCAAALFLAAAFLSAEPDNGRFLPAAHPAGIENIFFEATGGLAFPLSFVTQNFLPMTSYGGEFSFGAGYNWDGWLFGLEAGRDIWGQGVGSAALMQNFNNNLLLFKLQRVISYKTVKKFPKWFEIVPGAAVGIDFITTDYYPSVRAKNEGRLVSVQLFQNGANCMFYRFSLESSFYLGTDMCIPFAGGDYSLFYDTSLGGGFAGFWTAYAGVRTYPLGIINDIKRTKAEKAEQDAALAAQKAAEEEAARAELAAKDAAEKEQLAREQALIAQKAHDDMVASWPVPLASITADPREDFTPDNDGISDTALLTPGVQYLEDDPESWKIIILDQKNNIFRTWTGTGKLPQSIVWDGKSDDGKEVVFSRDTYQVSLSVVPDEKDRTRTGKKVLEAQDSIRTGILMEVIVPDHEWKIVVNTIYFDPDAATFNRISEVQRQANKDTLDLVARQIIAHGEVKVVVEGYANNVSNTERENTEELIPLSQSRADAIVRMLGERGLAAENLSAKGFGGAKPLAEWKDRANWWKNRRVEFRVTK